MSDNNEPLLRQCKLITDDRVTILLSDGSIYTCGEGGDEDVDAIRPGLSFSQPPQLLACPSLPTDILAVSTGGTHTLLLTTSNEIYGFGSNQFGQLAFPPSDYLVTTPVRLHVPQDYQENRRIRSVHASSSGGSFILYEDGSILSCGQCNCRVETTTSPSSALYPMDLTCFEGQLVRDIQANGVVHFLTDQGALYVWGWEDSSSKGSLGFPLEDMPVDGICTTPTRLNSLWNTGIRVVKSSCSSSRFSLIIDQYGHLHGWGSNQNGQLGLPVNAENRFIVGPRAIPILREEDGELERFKQVSCGSSHSLALTVDGHPYSFGGSNICGQLGREVGEEDCIVEGKRTSTVGRVSSITGDGREIAHVCAGRLVSIFICSPPPPPPPPTDDTTIHNSSSNESLESHGILTSLTSCLGSCGLGGRGSLIGGRREVLMLSFDAGPRGNRIEQLREGRRKVVFFTMEEAISSVAEVVEGDFVPAKKRRRLVEDDEELEEEEEEDEEGEEEEAVSDKRTVITVRIEYSKHPQSSDQQQQEPPPPAAPAAADSFANLLESVIQTSEYVESSSSGSSELIDIHLTNHFTLPADLGGLLRSLSDHHTIEVLGERLSGIFLSQCDLFCNQDDLLALAHILGQAYPNMHTFSMDSIRLHQGLQRTREEGSKEGDADSDNDSDNDHENAMAMLLESLVRHVPTLRMISVEDLGDVSFTRLVKAIIEIRPLNLETLIVNEAEIKKPTFSLIADLLDINLPSLHTLRLPDLSNLNNSTLATLSKGLKRNSHLEILDLHFSDRSKQKITNKGVKPLVQVIESNQQSALCALDISGYGGPDISVDLRKRLKRELIRHAKKKNRKLLKFARLDIWQNHKYDL
eukprot:scaffold2602_cov177-Ochromonas_danica.AAC.22